MESVPNNAAYALIQKATLEKLKCSKCRRYLSVLPIYTCSSGDSICGRCPVDTSSNFRRDRLYEYAIEFQKFPCSYRDNGCPEDLLPIQMGQHEETCTHKKHECPPGKENRANIWEGFMTIIANTFNISKKSSDSGSSVQDHSDSLDYEQLAEVECPICTEHLLPPIYQCDSGHSICATCKETQTACPTCLVATYSQNTRNFVLEKVVMNMIYPCKHEGCNFTTKACHIREHEATCILRPFSCPLEEYENCTSKFPISEMFNHVKTMHPEKLLGLDTVSVPFGDYVEGDIVEAYILMHSENIFRLRFEYRYDEDIFIWSVQLVGSLEDSDRYNFQLEIIDSSGRDMNINIKTYCTPLLDDDDTLDNSENCVYFYNDQICKFIKNQLTYRILITKKY